MNNYYVPVLRQAQDERCLKVLCKVSLMRRYLECGFSHPRARYFSLLVQRKVSKRNDPRMPLASCAPSVLSGFARKDIPVLLAKCGFLPHPSGLFPTKTPVLGAAYGIRCITTVWMQEVGGKMLLHFPHSPHPCGLAMQEQLPRRATTP
jgi:hypothetical protein